MSNTHTHIVLDSKTSDAEVKGTAAYLFTY